jgi:hypothetical protein
VVRRRTGKQYANLVVEPPLLGDDCGSFAAGGSVGSEQVRMGGVAAQCGVIGLVGASEWPPQ